MLPGVSSTFTAKRIKRMGIFTRILYFCISILFCDGEGGFRLPNKVYVSKPSDNYSATQSEPQTPARRLNFPHSFMEKITGRKSEVPGVQVLIPQSNQSFQVLLNSPPQEVSLPKLSQMDETVNFSQTDQPFQGTRASPVPAEKQNGPNSLFNVHSILKRTVLGYEGQDEKGVIFPPLASSVSAGCGNPAGGLFDLSDRNLSEDELRRQMDSRHCNATLEKVEELDASRNNLQMDLGTLLLLFLTMKNVQAINVSYNRITITDMPVRKWCNLEHSKLLFLNLSHNPLGTLRSICLPSSLKGIDLSFTRLNLIPEAFARTYFHIEKLNVQGNHFIYNPETISSLFGPKPPAREEGTFHAESSSLVNFPQHSPIESLPREGRHLVMSNCSIVELPEWFADAMRKLLFLDLSNNPMQAFPQLPTSLKHLDLTKCHIQEVANLAVFPNLTVFKVPNNNIKDLPFENLPVSIKELDVSKNQIPTFLFCRAPQELKFLNVSGNLIMHLNLSHSHNLTTLDASHNLITELQEHTGAFLPELKYLNLSGNKISFLQPGSLPESLLELDISNNVITIIMEETFGQLTNLNVLTVRGKHFFCNCDLYWFVHTYLASRQLQINGREDLLCSFPLKKRGLPVEDSNLTMLYCSLGLQMAVTACVAILAVSLLTALCWHFDGVWYIKMGWYWCMAKRKQDKKRPEHKLYDAFISYSENDALWAKETLLEELEALDFRVCYHERDFMPGHPVLGNIFYCIENSHKVLFVLSPSFVNSCWCQYELFFAEHRVLNENEDSLIMVVLEDLPPNSIPQKFSKLRKLLKRKTYLKWSPEEHKQKLFWRQLTAVLKTTNEPMASTGETGLQRRHEGELTLLG